MNTDTRTSSDKERDEQRVLHVRNLNVSYDMDRGVAGVINNIDIDIYREEILGIVGESGSGKSMFASALLDAVPEPGQINGKIIYNTRNGSSVDILDLSADELKKVRWEEISMVFQGAMSSFNPTMKIRDHFEETAEAHEMDLVSRMRHAYRLLEDLNLNPNRVMESYPHELSGGMTQRTLIALSLFLEPDVLVMDEPTAALDLLMQRSIINLLLELQEEYQITIIFITHELPLVAGLVDRLAVMYAFEFVEIADKYELLEDAEHPYSRAILNSVPSMDVPVERMQPIAGKSPDPVRMPTGCPFHPRCPIADERCESDKPDLRQTGPVHRTACHYPEKAIETIEYTIRRRDE